MTEGEMSEALDEVTWLSLVDPQTLKITWLDQRTFFTRSTERDQPNCPPRVDVYQVVSYDGRKLVLKSFWAGWNDRAPETETYVKQAR